MLVCLGLPTSISLYQKQVSDSTFQNNSGEQVSYHTNYCFFYTSVIRQFFEYASPVWQYSVTRAQSEQLKSIQKRAIHIIFTFSHGTSYPNLLFVSNLNSLKDRCDKLSRSFFQNMCNPASCLRHLLPPLRDTSVTSRLRSSTPLPHPPHEQKSFSHLSTSPSINTNHIINSSHTPVLYLMYLCLYGLC